MKHFLAFIFAVISFSYNAQAVLADEIGSNQLPECIVITHCARENLKVENVEDAFKKAFVIISKTPRTKVVEKTDFLIHAEAQTRWMKYTDDLLVKALPNLGIIQVRSESRVGIGDNGVNKKRIKDLAYRLMTNQTF